MVSRYLSANSACVAKGGLSAAVYELAAKYAGKTNVEVSVDFGFVGIFIGPTLLAVGYGLMRKWTARESDLKAIP